MLCRAHDSDAPGRHYICRECERAIDAGQVSPFAILACRCKYVKHPMLHRLDRFDDPMRFRIGRETQCAPGNGVDGQVRPLPSSIAETIPVLGRDERPYIIDALPWGSDHRLSVFECEACGSSGFDRDQGRRGVDKQQCADLWRQGRRGLRSKVSVVGEPPCRGKRFGSMPEHQQHRDHQHDHNPASRPASSPAGSHDLCADIFKCGCVAK